MQALLVLSLASLGATQTCARAVTALDSHLAITLAGKSKQISPGARETKSLGLLTLRKLKKSSGESELSPGDFLAFPGCFVSGMAAFSRRVRSDMRPFRLTRFSQLHRGTTWVFPYKCYPGKGVQRPKAFGAGARGLHKPSQRFPSLQDQTYKKGRRLHGHLPFCRKGQVTPAGRWWP